MQNAKKKLHKRNFKWNSVSTKLLLIGVILPSVFMLSLNIISEVFIGDNLTSNIDQNIESTAIQSSQLISQADDSLELLYQEEMQAYDTNIQDQVYAAYNIVDYYYNQFIDGNINETTAQDQAKAVLRTIRYGAEKNGYLFINNHDNVAVMNGANPSVEGTDYTDVADVNGDYFVRDMISIAESTDGEGYLNYYFNKVGESEASAKRTFIMNFDEWGWALGTGNYIDDIDEHLAEMREIFLQEMRNQFGNISLMQGYLFAVDTNGTTQIHQDQTKVGDDFGAIINEDTNSAIMDEIESLDGEFYNYKFVGEEKRSYIKRVEGVHFDFYIVTVVSLSVIEAEVNAVTNIMLIIMIVAVVIMIVIGLLFSRSLSTPIKSLTEDAQTVSKGDYSIEIESDRKDELGDLATAFSIMVHDVKMNQEFIRKLVDSSASPLMHLDKDLKIQDIGESLLVLTGYKREDYLGLMVDVVFADVEEKNATIKYFENNKKLDQNEFKLKNSLGKIIIVQATAVQLISTEGEDWGTLTTFVDVTKIKDMIGNVTQIASEVSSMSTQIAESSNQINFSVQEVTRGSQEVARGSQHQSTSVNDISAAVIKVQELSQNIVSKTGTMAGQSEAGQEMAQKGKVLTDDLLARIDAINDGAVQVSTVMDSLSFKSNEINKIVDVISGIATETNLLALNAAIEAARAGDAGKGFAVVAEQVRKLAEDSKQAADQINDLINVIQKEVSLAVTTTGNVSIAIDLGKSAIDGTKVQLDALFEVIAQTNTGIQETLKGINDQDQHINKIVDNVEQINAVIQQSSGTAQELSSSTEEMASTLEEMTAGTEELNSATERLYDEMKKL